jgi:hypothetical protein
MLLIPCGAAFLVLKYLFPVNDLYSFSGGYNSILARFIAPNYAITAISCG